MPVDRVRLLPDKVVDQIAAGEVVDRPASVLKELMENAVDAGGTSVEAEVSGPFPFDLRITDRGCGMTASELRLAVRRHTTSKIADVSDLDRISTYGFRGEALPSIASVSRLRIVTRTPDADAGTELIVDGGEEMAFREAGAATGTTVEVSGLFDAVPARRKFLKSPRTEMSHLHDVFHAVAIPREGISFRLTEGRASSFYEAGESRIARAKRHAGDDAAYLVEVEVASPFYKISGWVGLPHVAKAGAFGILLFCNGRFFRDRSVLAALREAYRGIAAPDRYPVARLFIDCSPGDVDVNVHPSKSEIRFRHGRELFELLRHGVSEALARKGIAPAVPRLVSTGGGSGPFGGWGGRSGGDVIPADTVASLFGGRGDGAAGLGVDASTPEWIGGLGVGAAQDAATSAGGFSSWTPLLQIHGTYIVCAAGDDLVVVDQHAADERIIFSRLKGRFLGADAPVQRWLMPVTVALPHATTAEREAVEAFLAKVGLLFEADGEESWILSGGPAVLGRFDATAFWDDFVAFLGSQEEAPKGIFDADRALWRMACHGSTRGGERLSIDAMRKILSDLDAAESAHSCPHGRPVWVRISRTDLERLFHR